MAISQTTELPASIKLILGAPSTEAPANVPVTLAALVKQHRDILGEMERTATRLKPAGKSYDPSLWPHFGDLARAEEMARAAVIAHRVDTLAEFRVKAEHLLDLLNSPAEIGPWLDKVDTWKLLMSVTGSDYRATEH